MRKLNKTLKNKFARNKKHTCSYLGGYNKNLINAQKEMPSYSQIDNSIYWLKTEYESNPNQVIEKLINKLTKSQKLLKKVSEKIENLIQ
jgi:hypothetical protein